MSELRIWIALISLAATLPLAGCEKESQTNLEPEPQAETPPAVDAARIAAADSEPGSWLAHGRTYSEQRYSPLTQINAANVARLGLAWSQELGSLRGVEASPIVADGRMYVTASWSTISALDAKTGDVLWRYDPKVPREVGINACCDVVNRGVALWKGSVYAGTIDGRLVSLNADTGALNWEVQTTDPDVPYTITGAPRVVKDLVIIGNGGGEYGVRGYLTAYHAATGEQAWRFYTVPGDPNLPFEHPELADAAKTWTGEWWKVGGGGTPWDSMAYDPELDLLYVGTGNGSPWTRTLRSPGGGDNLYLSSILALRPETGELVWHYQTTPGDNWDYTATQHIVLAEIELDGEPRKVLMQAPKNGFFYVIDRETGELLSADAYVRVNWASHVDLETGRPVETEDGDYSKKAKRIAPQPFGGHNWHSMTYSPRTGLVYIPARDMEAWYAEEDPDDPAQTKWKMGNDFLAALDATLKNDPLKAEGFVIAWDPVARKQVWRAQNPSYWSASLLSTATDLLFSGGADGKFRAMDARTGKLLWSAESQTGIMAPPISYELDGEQYIAVAAGWGGGTITNVPVPGSAVLEYENEGRVLVFKLGGSASMPTNAKKDWTLQEIPPVTASALELRRGSRMYHENCYVCHGAFVQSSGILPDLRYMKPDIRQAFQSIVRLGAYEGKGMPGFAEPFNEEEVELIRQYINSQATLLEKPSP